MSVEFGAIKQIEDEFQIETYSKMNISVERGLGTKVWTSDGVEFLDLYGGHAVCATGHCHPHVVASIKDQAEKLLFYSNLVYSEIRAKAAEKLASVAPAGLSKVFFCNSGTEANENAMRMARMATGREKIVSFTGGFHGRTADSISATFLGKYREIGRPNVPLHVEAEFGDLSSIETVIDSETAGVIIEPIQSMAGVREADPEFFRRLREVCDRVGAKLIFDEVQTGIGRTGSWFFAGSDNAAGVVPDIVTLAKSLGSGIPVGACLISRDISESIKLNDLGTTFGGGMISMAAVIATIEAIDNDEMLKTVASAERFLREQLSSVAEISQIKGKGCLIGIEFTSDASDVHKKLLDEHIITGTSSDKNVLRLLMPLNVKLEELEALVRVVKK